MKHNNMWICSLDADQKSRTCGYWYTVTCGSMAHTAFETRDAALAWMHALGLSIDGELPQEGTHGSFRINGEYRRECVMCSEEAWVSLPGIPIAVLENGSYRPGKLHEENGVRVLFSCNANNKWAPEYNYHSCRKMCAEGITVL